MDSVGELALGADLAERCLKIDMQVRLEKAIKFPIWTPPLAKASGPLASHSMFTPTMQECVSRSSAYQPLAVVSGYMART